MTKPRTIWRGVPTLLDELCTADEGAETSLKRFFRARPKLGPRERNAIADAMYGCLRQLRSIDYALDSAQPNASNRLGAWMCLHHGWSAATARSALGGDDALQQTLSRLRGTSDAPAAIRAELPDWLYDALSEQLPADEVLQLGLALQQHAPLDLRVNTLIGKPAKALAALTAAELPFQPCHWSPIGLRHAGTLPVHCSAAFRNGLIELQDEGSQLIAPLLEPRRGETVIDLCAGAGGKTLHLAALMANQGVIHAFDPAARRLQELQQRCRRAGVNIVRASRIEDEQAVAVQRLRGKADRVLVDAPCSGTGTLRRHPAIRWQSHHLTTLNATQDRLLDSAAALLRPGGRLVYATCSLLAAENEQRATAFRQRHPEFRPLPLADILKRRNIALSVDLEQTALRLYPHRHDCDGFYAAVFEKAAR